MAPKKIKSLYFLKSLFATSLMITLGACAISVKPLETPKVEPLFTSQNCPSPAISNGLHWFPAGAKWASLKQKLVSDSHVKFFKDEQHSDKENYNGVLLVSLGQKTSGGYKLGLGKETPFISVTGESGGEAYTLSIPLLVTEPAAGAMKIMVLTNPCLGLAVSGDVSFGQIDFIQIVSSPASIFKPIQINSL